MLNPRLITVHVKVHETNKLKVKWSMHGLSFPPYYTDRDMVQRKSDDIRKCLKQLVEHGMKNNQFPQGGNQLKDLAKAGFELYQALFFDAGESQISPEIIQNWLKNQSGQHQITFSIDSRIYVPWGLIYDVDVNDLDENLEDIDIRYYQDFWCLKYYLSSVYCRITPQIIDKPKFRSAFKVIPILHKAVFLRAVQNLKISERKAQSIIFSSLEPPVYSNKKRELFTRWKKLGDKVGLLYFYCHANGTSLALNIDDEIPMDALKLNFRRKKVSSGGQTCLVFLNGCSTAVGDSGGGFLEATGGPEFCGFIGTEAKVPDVFAFRFGLAFLYHYLYKGKPLFQVMDFLRKQHWPLSLLYNIACYPELCIAREKSVKQLPRIPKENFSFSHLGTEEL